VMPEAGVMAEAVQPGVAEAVVAMADGGDPAAASEAVAAARRRERVGREGAEGKRSGGESEEGRKASHVRHSMIRLLADQHSREPGLSHLALSPRRLRRKSNDLRQTT
jgi:hypothetical protein